MAEPDSPEGTSAQQKAESMFPSGAVAIAAAALLLLAAVLVLLGRRHGGDAGMVQSAAYAAKVELSEPQMSQSESLSGGRSTYLDGRIANRGPLTVSGVTVRVRFPTDSGSEPQTLTVPLQLIRTREPYVDTEPLRAVPLAPGRSAEFRLILEGVTDAWNEQPPALEVVGVVTH